MFSMATAPCVTVDLLDHAVDAAAAQGDFAEVPVSRPSDQHAGSEGFRCGTIRLIIFRVVIRSSAGGAEGRVQILPLHGQADGATDGAGSPRCLPAEVPV